MSADEINVLLLTYFESEYPYEYGGTGVSTSLGCIDEDDSIAEWLREPIAIG